VLGLVNTGGYKLLEVILRSMQKEDVKQIMEIESVSFGSHHWTEHSFISEMNNPLGSYFTAIDKKKQKVIGYCGFWLICDEAHITTIAVHPDYRQNKIGELLLQKMINTGYSKMAKWFTLEVRASNIAAQGLYTKYDFKSLGTRKKYYQDNDEDALIMWTENIWDSKFKNKFSELEEKLKNNNLFCLVTGY